jgi:hypothetical protein
MPVDENVNTRARSYRVTDSSSGAYFDVNFIFAPFIHSREFTAFVDPVGYVELGPDGRRVNPTPVFFQAEAPEHLLDWFRLAQLLVDTFLEYKCTGSTYRMEGDPVLIALKEKEPSKVEPVVRVSRYEREPVI